MKVLFGIIAVVMVAAGLLFVTAQPSDSTNTTQVKAVNTWQTIQDNLRNGSQLVDVRTPEEYATGHIEGAVLLPLSDIQNSATPNQDKSKPVYVYCRSGNRSAQAASLLQKAGFTTVVDLGAYTNVLNIGGITTK